MPGAQLVTEPLPVPARAGLPHAPAMDVGEIQLETGRPALPALGMVPGQITDILGRGAEAGGAHHRAVSAGQTPAGYLGPVRRLPGVPDQRGKVYRRHRAAHPLGSGAHLGPRGLRLGPGCVAVWHLGQDARPLRAARLGHEPVPGIIDPLGEREIVAWPSGRPVPIDAQKHTPPGSVQFTAMMNSPWRVREKAPSRYGPPLSTWPRIPVAARSQPRTPRNA